MRRWWTRWTRRLHHHGPSWGPCHVTPQEGTPSLQHRFEPHSRASHSHSQASRRTRTIWGRSTKSGAATIAQSGLQEGSLDCPEVVKKTSRSRYYKPANPGHVLMQQLLTPWSMRSPSPSVAAGRMSHTDWLQASVAQDAKPKPEPEHPRRQVVGFPLTVPAPREPASPAFPLMTNREQPCEGECEECSVTGMVLKVGKGKPYCAACWHRFVTPRAASVRASQQSVPTVKTVSRTRRANLLRVCQTQVQT